MTPPRRLSVPFALAALTLIVAGGIAYSVKYDTALDTSNPLLAHIPRKAYFAQKSNIFNVLFVKRAWGWTSAAFFSLYFTSPPDLVKVQRLGRWAASTFVWAAFTSWFFGPALFDRLISLSGGQCVIHIPSEFAGTDPRSNYLVVPEEYCWAKTSLSPHTHPTIFTPLFTDPEIIQSLTSSTPDGPLASLLIRPRFYKGHDVSGHLFLLTLSILFLVDQLSPSLRLVFSSSTPPAGSKPTPLHVYVVRFTTALVALWFWMAFTTSVYFHTPAEKISGFLIGVAGYSITKALV